MNGPLKSPDVISCFLKFSPLKKVTVRRRLALPFKTNLSHDDDNDDEAAAIFNFKNV